MNDIVIMEHDIVTLTVDLPGTGVRKGQRGAVVHCGPASTYEVEFVSGETSIVVTLTASQIIKK